MTTISNNDIACAIYLSVKDKNEKEQVLFFPKITQFLFKRRFLSQAPDILSRLDKMINEADQKIIVKLSSQTPLSENIKKEVADILKERYSAKKIILIENLDEKLLGGFKIEVNNEIIDLTLKNKIEKLQEYLTKVV